MVPAHVLVPLDGSPLADEALQHALAVYDCRITVLNVITPVDAFMSEGGILELSDQRQQAARERADRLLDRARDHADATDRTIETVVEMGDPVDVISSYAETTTVDHVVMGGHGGESGGLAQRLLGTVASAIVDEVPTSVTVVR